MGCQKLTCGEETPYLKVVHNTFKINKKSGAELYRYGYNGKEYDSEVYGNANFYDYGLRMYDSRLCRFITVDPLTRKFAMLTPYQFASNSPILNIDLDGAEALNSQVQRSFYQNNTQVQVQNSNTVQQQVEKAEFDPAVVIQADISFGPNSSNKTAIGGHGVGVETGLTTKLGGITFQVNAIDAGKRFDVNFQGMGEPNIKASGGISTPYGSIEGNVEGSNTDRGPQITKTSVSATAALYTATMSNSGNGPEYTQNTTLYKGSYGAGLLRVDISITTPEAPIENNGQAKRDPNDVTAATDATTVTKKPLQPLK